MLLAQERAGVHIAVEPEQLREAIASVASAKNSARRA